MDTPRVDVSHPADGVAVLLMDNGPMNFGNARLHGLMEEALTEARDNGTLVMVLASAVPGYFLAHGHIGEIVGTMTGTAASDGDPRAFLRLQKELDTGPMVSLAAIEGQAWGGGAELAWSCDFRVASEGSTLGQPEILVGLPPAGGATRMSRIAGEAAARRLVLDGRPVSAREAFRLGLVDMLVGNGSALDAAVQWATWLAGRPASHLALAKNLIVGSRDMTLGEALRRETGSFVERFTDPDVVERALEVQGRYDDGADSYDAFGIPRG
jgi:enoyl-CoA hydratase